jgi:undecaprenyl pyrophosphate phosphatase UppP
MRMGSLGQRRKGGIVTMAEKDTFKSGLLRSSGRLGLWTVLVGTLLIGLFKTFYPQTDVTKVLSIAAVASILIACGLNFLWMRWRGRKDKKGGKT